jgi:hypothetical protein
MLLLSRIAPAAALGAALIIAGAASAVQFPLPTLDARLHTLTSGQPGAEWNTGGTGSGGDIDYDSGTERLTLTAGLDVLNYYDPNNGACATDAAPTCSHNFVTNLDLTVEADLASISITSLGFGFWDITLNFESTGGTDITLVDPTDLTTLLSASWQSGTFLGNATDGLTVAATFDDGTFTGDPAGLTGDPTAVGFATIAGGDYAPLFDSGGTTDVSLHLSEFFDFSPSTTAIAAAIVANFEGNGGTHVDNSALIDFTNEGQGQIFRVASGDFHVPEPGTALLLSPLLLILARRRAA